MSKYFVKMPKWLNLLMLIVAGSLRKLFSIQMSYNYSLRNFSINNIVVEASYVGLFTTIIFSGIIYALVVRLFMLIGYRIANTRHIKKTLSLPNASDRLLPIDYLSFKSIASGYLSIGAFAVALLNIPMYIFPLSYSLFLVIGVFIEIGAIVVMAFDLQNIMPPEKCSRAFNALLLPFGVIIFLRIILGV
ncbi:MAG: hypothetical protein EOM87_04015 [Clostridia bacterium]|nr:hypothetical protein [Clostridia bacterium]